MLFVGALADNDRQGDLFEWKILASRHSFAVTVLGVKNHAKAGIGIPKVAIDLRMQQPYCGPTETGNLACPRPDLLFSIRHKEGPPKSCGLRRRDVWPVKQILALEPGSRLSARKLRVPVGIRLEHRVVSAIWCCLGAASARLFGQGDPTPRKRKEQEARD